MSKMKRFQANPFFSVPLIGSLIYRYGNLQEDEPTVSGERQQERKRIVNFLNFCVLYLYTHPYPSFTVFSVIPCLPFLSFFLFFGHKPTGENPSDFTAQRDNLTHANNAEVFYFPVILLYFFLSWYLCPTCCKR